MLIEVKVSGLTIDPITNTPIVILKDKEEKKVIPIWIGLFEASAIATELEKINFSRHLRQVPEIASSHHEKLDGSGYPKRLKGEQIPQLARILAVCDVFDALTSNRPYRDRMNIYQVLKILNDGSGKDFDTLYIDALKKIKLNKLLTILEDEHQHKLVEKDLNFLTAFTLTDLLAGHESENLTPRQQTLKTIFLKYYSRQYLKDS